MQTMLLNKLTSPVRSFAAGTCVVLFAALTLCLGADPAYGVAPPTRIVATGAPVQIGITHYPSGNTSAGWDGGNSPLSGTFVIGANGNVIAGDGYNGTYDAFEITPSGTQTVLASGGGGNSTAAAMDKFGNVYIGLGYSGTIYKLPYNSATGTYAGFSAVPTANCSTSGGAINATDTAPCIFAPNLSAFNGIAGLAFDGAGDLIVATDYNQYSGSGNQKNNNLILICNAACETESDGQGTNAPAQIFSDGSGATTPMGAIAVDPWGNIFFTDGANGSGGVSNLKEIVATSLGNYGTLPATPTVVESYTNADSYTNGLGGIAVGADGTVFFSTNTDGIFGIPRASTTHALNMSGIYVVSNTAGAKAITVDSYGNFAIVTYSNAASQDAYDFVPAGSVAQLGSSALNPGTPATATVTIIDSAGACTGTTPPALTLAATRFGATTTEYTASAASGCSKAAGTNNGTFAPAFLGLGSASSAGAVTSTTISFAPTAAGTRNATLTITDSTNHAVGSVALTGTGQGAIANVDPGTPVASISTGLNTPVSAVSDPSGDLFVADSSTGKVYENTTATTVGSGLTSPSSLAFDANGNLFIADSGTGAVYEILNAGTTGAFVPGSQVTVIGAGESIGGEPLETPEGLAVGPDGTLYISDWTEGRVVAINPATGVGGLTVAVGASGLLTPQGLAADAAGNLYVADPGAGEVFIFSAAGVESTLSSVSGVTKPVGVAVDASGSVLIADGPTGNIVRVPSWNDQSQTAGLTPSEAITLETISPQVSSLAMDSSGNIAVASTSGKAAYEIQRNAGSINLGQVPDGFSKSGTVYLMNAGNEPATVGSVTEPSNHSWITLDPATTNGCQPGTGPAGAWCMLTATFAPPTGFATGSLVSDTAKIVVTTPSEQIPVTISGTPTSSPAQQQVVSFSQPACATTNPTTCSGYVGQQVTLSATAIEGSTAPNPGTPTGLAVSLGSTSPSSTCTLSTTTASGNTYSVTITLNGAGTCTVNATAASGSGPGNTPFGQATAQVPIAVSTITTRGVPALVVNQGTFIGDISGGFTSGNNPAGGSLAINTVNGDVIEGNTYGNATQIWAPSSSNGYPVTYTVTNVGTCSEVGSGTGGTSVDLSNNIYAGCIYWSHIYKVPFVSGAYATTVPAAVPQCAGGAADTTQCYISLGSGLAYGETGVTATLFDANGNLYFVSEPSGAAAHKGLNGVYMIPAASLATISSGTANVTPLYTSDVDTISSIALDANNNLFFTDSAYVSGDMSSSGSASSNLYELANTGTASAPTYTNSASAPVLLESYTDSSPGNYDDIMSGVAADQTNGIVYFSTKSDGIWAFANNGTPFTATSLPSFYAAAGNNGTTSDPGNMTGGKALAVGPHGSLYAVGYDPGNGYSDDLYKLTFGGTASPITTQVAAFEGAVTTGPAVVVDNALPCTTAANLAFTFTGADASEFLGSQGSGCTSIAVGGGTFGTPINSASSYRATISFNPQVAYASSATMTVSDIANGGEGTATVSGYAMTTPQTITFTAPATATSYTYSPGMTITIQATSTGASSGATNAMQFAIDPSSTAQGTISTPVLSNGVWSATLNVTQACITATATAADCQFLIDASQSGGLVNGVYYQAASGQSPAITINQATQTVTFPPIIPSTYVYTPTLTVPLNASSSTALPVIFKVDASSTGNGTISGSTLTVTQACNTATPTSTLECTIVIDAIQVGTADYLPAQAQQSIVVNQASPTITFTPITTPIYFIATSPGVTGGIAVPVSATSSGSNNQIVFSVDPMSGMTGSFSNYSVKGTTTAATLTIPPVQPNNATSGTIIIDATQAASDNYAAVTYTYPAPLAALSILPPLTTQLISFNNPGTQVVGTPMSISALATSGLPVSLTSTTTSVCTLSGTTVALVSAGTCTIVATQPGDSKTYAAAPSMTQSFTVNSSGQNPTFTVDLSLSALTLSPGTSGTSQLTVTSTNNFTGSLILSCSGLPSGYTCSFNPNTITISENGAATSTITVTPPASAALVRHGTRPLVPFTALAVALCFFGFKKRTRLQLLVVLALGLTALGALSACGGTSSTTTTKSTTSTATITVSASGLSGASAFVKQSTTLTVTLE